MGMTTDNYQQALLNLLPPGNAYPRYNQGVMSALIKAMAEDLARVDLRVDNLLNEADPRVTLELLPDWERALAIDAEDTVATRQQAVVSLLTMIGGQSRAYFIARAASIGFTITITEFHPYTCETPIDQPIYEDDCRFVWQVNAPETTIREATCQSPCSEPLRSWGNDILENMINHYKPAHTIAIFAYGG